MEANIDEEAQKIANFAANHPDFASEELPPKCRQNLKPTILKHWRQVVAGMNYKFAIEFVSTAGPGCPEKMSFICKDVVVQKPIGCFDEYCHRLDSTSMVCEQTGDISGSYHFLIYVQMGH